MMICETCGEPCVVGFWGPVGSGGVCRDPMNPNDDDEGQHVALIDRTRSSSLPCMTATNPRSLLEGDVFEHAGSTWAVGPQGYDVGSDGVIELPCYPVSPDGTVDSDAKMSPLRLSEADEVDVITNLGYVDIESKAGPVEVPENNLVAD